MNPQVSIITPVYNSSKYLHETLKSVENQSYEDWEHILVDDCSSDESLNILQNFSARDSRYKVFINSKNFGSGYSRNLAIQAAKGRYIAFLDSDDLWHPKKLENHLTFIRQRKAVFSHTSYGYIDKAGNRIKDTFHVSLRPISYVDLLKRTEISCLTAIYDAGQIGKFYMSSHRRKQDYALWLKILKAGYKSHGLDEELAFYRQHNESATSNKLKLLIRHVKFLKETQDFNTIQAAYYTGHWLINGISRYYIR